MNTEIKFVLFSLLRKYTYCMYVRMIDTLLQLTICIWFVNVFAKCYLIIYCTSIHHNQCKMWLIDSIRSTFTLHFDDISNNKRFETLSGASNLHQSTMRSIAAVVAICYFVSVALASIEIGSKDELDAEVEDSLSK